MTTRDPRHRSRRYDGALGRQQFMRWLILGVRVLAVPTVLMSLLLAVDAVLPGTGEDGVVYRRATDARWVGTDGYELSLGWLHRSGCLEQQEESGRHVLFPERPGCSGTVDVSPQFGRRMSGGDTVRVVRTPLYGQTKAVKDGVDGSEDRRSSLLGIGLYVLLGLVPLLSFGEGFAVYSEEGAAVRYHGAYVLPVLVAEAVYMWLLWQALGL